MRIPARDWLSGTTVSALGFALALGAPAAAAQSFEEALALSYRTNPTLIAERAELRAANEEIAQALAGYRPELAVTGNAGVEWQDADLTAGGSTDGTINPAALGIELSQPLYRGGRTVAGVTQAENVIQAARAAFVTVEQEVLLNAVAAYMDVVRDQAVLELARNNEQVLRRQLQAARDRFEVGEVTRTDVSQAEARLAAAVARRIETEGALRAARATFRRVVGVVPGALEAPEPVLRLPASLDEAVALAADNNPALIAQIFTERAAEAGVDVVRGELLPEISLTGAVRRSYEPTAAIDRSDSASVSVRLTVPLYQSGAVSSRVREARHIANEERIRIVEARRQVVEQAIRAWEGLMTARASIDSLQARVRAADVALEGVRLEAQVGARTVLDLLDAEQELLDARVALVQAQRNEVVAGFEVLQAIGELTARDLALPVEYYAFDPDYDATRRRWRGTAVDEIEAVE